MKYFKKILLNQSGLTLIEMLIAVGLFVVVMLISTSMFMRSIESQTRSTNSKNLQESLNYALTLMSSEASLAIQSPVGCIASLVDCIDATQFFCAYSGSPATKLAYRNKDNVCVVYELEDDANGISRLKMTRGGGINYITPPTVRVTALAFNAGNVDDATYPIGETTIAITGQSVSNENSPETLRLQTSVAIFP